MNETKPALRREPFRRSVPIAFVLAVLASTAWTPVARGSDFPAVIELSLLDGNSGVQLDSTHGREESGYSVSIAGDVNGDGVDDVVIGAPGADSHGRSAGSSYVVFGKTSGFPKRIKLSSLDGSNGFRLDGEHSLDQNGISVAGAGDVNGDGFDDVIIGARLADPGGKTEAGSTYVVLGKASGFPATIDLSTLDGSNGFRLDGTSIGDRSGRSVAGAGDVNGDGFDDVIVGAPYAKPHPHGNDSGSSYVVFGKASGFPKRIKLANLDGSNGFRLDGIAADDRSGSSVAGAGDVNGDGFDDVIIGSWASQYLVFGKASGFSKRMKLSKLDGSNGFRLDGVVGYYRLVAGAGDVNGDGFDDLITGSYGSTYVVFGKASSFPAAIELVTLNGTNGFRLNGYGIGKSAAGAGDVNGDGFDDVMVANPSASPHGLFSGSTYVIFGKASGFAATVDLSTLDGNNGFRLDGEHHKDESGFSVTRAGDFNGDGISDLLIGAPTSDPGGIFDAGSSYVVFGRAPDSVRTRRGSAAAQ